MGEIVYWLLVGVILAAGLIMPQEGKKRIFYIILITVVNILVCGLRYQHLVGDLMKYHSIFNHWSRYNIVGVVVENGYRNIGFFLLMNMAAKLSNVNYQVFLLLLAVLTQTALAFVVYEYSPKPWMSFLVWHCFSFLVTYDYCAIKQGIAMAAVMIAFLFIMKDRPREFLVCTLIAGLLHMPALCFLPAYWIAHRKVSVNTVVLYVIFAVFMLVFRNQIVAVFSELYYSDNEEADFFMASSSLGGRFLIIAAILLAGLLTRGAQNEIFVKNFNLVVAGGLLQMYSGFDNVFTRLADYYLMFLILYLPMIFYDNRDTAGKRIEGIYPLFPFTEDSRRFFASLAVLFLVWFYWRTCLGAVIEYAVDDYLNFRFLWDV
ncbi:MAG: EpsG family protein [Solobacterium sp.]|nr:EpsG family protein [Solobacterium sp.]